MKRWFCVGLLVAVGTVGCAPRRIPGTEIPDTDDTRQILEVMERYRQGVEGRDAEAVLSVVHPTFSDDAGTREPEDDLDYDRLREVLPRRLAQAEDVKLEISVRDVQVEGPEAIAIYYYTSSFRAPELTTRPQVESGLMKMGFRKQDGEWRIVSGL